MILREHTTTKEFYHNILVASNNKFDLYTIHGKMGKSRINVELYE